MGSLPRRFFALCCLLFATGCGSSTSTSVTAPTSVRCAVSLEIDTGMVSASGGSGQLAIDVNRECAWTARAESDWITLSSPASGQGDGTVGYSVAANSSVSSRRGAIAVNEQRVEISQAAAPCLFALSSTGDSFDASGGSRTIAVSAQASCAWTTASQAAWITVVEGSSGNGDGHVTISVASNGVQPRSAAVLIAGQTYVVSQAGATAPPPPGPAPNPPLPSLCTLSVAPLTLDVPASASTRSVRVTVSAPSCTWSVTPNASWLTLASPASGSGSADVGLAIAANTSTSARSATVTIIDRTITVNQAPASGANPPTPTCSFTVDPTSQSVPAGGGDFETDVSASQSSCAWTASSAAPWMTITSGTNNTGNGRVRYTVAANTSASQRSATLTVAGQMVTVTQAAAPPPCTFGVSPTSQSVPSQGGDHDVRVEPSKSSCAWTATSNAPWITITAGASGTGTADVRYTVAANSGTSTRSGTLTVAGQTVTVTQEAPPPPPIRLEGSISGLTGSCPSVTFTLQGRVVRTNSATSFQGGCNNLRNGVLVRVDGLVQGDGSVLASRVTREGSGDDDLTVASTTATGRPSTADGGASPAPGAAVGGQ